MKLTYKHTIFSCFMGYITQAIVNNFIPLLFFYQEIHNLDVTQTVYSKKVHLSRTICAKKSANQDLRKFFIKRDEYPLPTVLPKKSIAW